MKAGGTGGRVAVLLLAIAVSAGMSAAPARADSAAAVFDPSKMYVIDLTLPQASIDVLEDSSATYQPYQPGEFSFAVSEDGTPAGLGEFSEPVDAEIRLKGNFSFRPLSGKAAFKVRFDKSQLFHGLRVLTLNSMVSDPSMIHETLAYTAYRGAGVPASRSGYAYVYVNGEDYGIHLNIETMDRIALEKLFGPFDEEVQHLYEGEDGDDTWPGSAPSFEVDEGDEGDRSDLEALIAAVNSNGPPDWPTRVASVLDVEQMATMWAAEKYIGQWDGYAGQEESWTPNNYYLYSDAAGKFQMLPWGNDETWELAHRLPFDGPAGRMFDRCLGDMACLAIYHDAVSDVRDAIAGLGLDALATQSAALLAPWRALEEVQSTREEHDCAAFQAGVSATRAFVAGRDAEAAKWLGEPLGATSPLGPEIDLCTVRPGGSVKAGGGNGSPAATPAQRLWIVRAWTRHGILRTRLSLPGPGRVSLRAVASIAGTRIVFCTKKRRVKSAQASLIVRCRLPAKVHEALRQHKLEIALTTRFRPTAGRPQRVTRHIVLARA